MREVSPGDLIFSFMDTRIQAVGIAESYCWESPRLPKDHIDVIRRLLPERYSPLQPNGNGLQSVYLTEIPASLAAVLMGSHQITRGHLLAQPTGVIGRRENEGHPVVDFGHRCGETLTKRMVNPRIVE
jgi:putative restriction endonuclease